jgi:hypothetical protein
MEISEEYRRGFEDARKHAILATRIVDDLGLANRSLGIRKHLESLTPELCLQFKAEQQDVMRRNRRPYLQF